MRNHGLTLPELLTVLAIISITASSTPLFATALHKQRAHDSASQLASNLRYARTYAVLQQTGVTVRAINDDWAQGWRIFTDSNRNALQDAADEPLRSHSLANGILVVGNQPVTHYVHFSMTGETEQTSGSFQAGTIRICSPASPEAQYAVILGKSGRIRLEKTSDETPCG